MMEAKLKRKLRAQSKPRHAEPRNQMLLPPKVNLRRLSFSFYAQDTIRNHKQLILDNCDIAQEIPEIPAGLTQAYHRAKTSLKSHSLAAAPKRKESLLKMEDYFFGGKCDQIDLVPTNASHNELRESEGAKKKEKSRASSARFKDSKCEGKAEKQAVGTANGRCKTSCKRPKKSKQ